MHKSKRIVTIVYLLAFVLLTIGCSKNSLYQKAEVQLTPDNPNIIPSSTIVTDIAESVITATLITGVSCSVIGYDLTYQTILGDNIDSLNIYNIKTERSITASVSDNEVTPVDQTFPVRPYTEGVMNLLQSSTSAISPIRATVNVHFKDVNNNEFSEKVHFLCWKYVPSSE
mgnify:CR=1 FL=1